MEQNAQCVPTMWTVHRVIRYLLYTEIPRFIVTPGAFPWGGGLGYFLGGYVPPGTPNWHPVLKKISLKLIFCSRKFVN